MVSRRGWGPTLLALAFACSSSPPQSGGGFDAAAGEAASGASGASGDAGTLNVAPLVVDQGPPGAQAVNVAYTTVTLCRPGTTVCQTIDHVEVDTGSVGLRIIASVLDASLMLPQQTSASGGPLVECYQYADGYNWGPVVTADVRIGGETAAALPLQIAGGASSTPVPSDCSRAGTEEDTVSGLGGNGIVGLGYESTDCGSTCANTTSPRAGSYYACTGAACTASGVPLTAQVQNPIALFARDNNGVALELPSIDSVGAATVTGSLIFGIGTAPNNGLGAAQVITIDTNTGSFTTVFGGQALAASFIDSGSLAYSFPDSAVAQCSGNQTGFYCPTSALDLMATNEGFNRVNIPTSFSVANATTLYASGDAAFDDLAITAFAPGYFDWGLPFFYGRTVFTAMSGATTPAGSGPYFAY
jgi:Protein of unknown function (DUF3443)